MKKFIFILCMLSSAAYADNNSNTGNNNHINTGTQVSGVGNSVGGTHAGNIDVSNRNTNTNVNGQSQSQSNRQNQNQGQAQGQHQSSRNDNSNDGNSQSVAFNDKRQTASAYAPGLTSGIDTCLGSMSGGVSTGVVGVSLGGTMVDENCIRLKNSRELERKGYKKASMAILCKDKDVREAMELENTPCPPVAEKKEPVSGASVTKSDCQYPTGNRNAWSNC